MFTIDASVYINALREREKGNEISLAFLQRLTQGSFMIYSPTLLYVEVAATLARLLNNSEAGVAAGKRIRALPGQTFLPLDESLAEEASRLGAERRLRGADAVYAAVALRRGATLVTLDGQQIERLRGVIDIQTPQEALEKLGGN